jgi:hypothetical protein
VRVVGYIYDKEANKEDNSCFGIHCFMLSFLILAGVTFLAFLVSLALYFRTRRFYKLVVLKRLKHYARWWRMYLPAFYHKVAYKGLYKLWIWPVLYVQFEKYMYFIILSIMIWHCCLWLWAWFFTSQIPFCAFSYY